jgi:hypothetical protein
MENAFVDALFSAEWIAVAGFCLMALVFLSRKLVTRLIPKSDLDLFAAGLAVLAGIAAGLVTGGGDWQVVLTKIVVALGAGAMAVGFWELAGARLERWWLARKG